MKASASKRLHWSFKIFIWINVLVSVGLIGSYLGTHIPPDSFVYFAYLGLAFPFLLIMEILFLILWLFIKRKLIFISLLTLLIGWNHIRHFYVITLWQTELTNSIKVMSFNVRIFNLYDTENRIQNRNEILNFLNKEQADILCFQEFYHQQNSTSFVTKDTIVALLQTNYYHERYTHHLSQERYFGVATFSKYPIVHQGEIPFENDPNNYCIFSDIVVERDTIRVFNGHLGSIRLQDDDYEFFGDPNGQKYPHQDGQRIVSRLKIAFEKRAVQARKVAEVIRESPYPVIFCADLNDTPVSYCYRQFNRLLEDAFVNSGNGIGQTYIGKVPSNRIDYIFSSDDFDAANFTTHQQNFSDHKPLSCEFQLKQN